MARYREWYEDRPNQTEWMVKHAMGTIQEAAETKYGRATWLLPLSDGRPVAEKLECPFSNPDRRLAGKDWTKYGGYLHTDHSIRSEFFSLDAEKPASVREGVYLEDFTYLYDRRSSEFRRFIEGEASSVEAAYDELGEPDTWQKLKVSPLPQRLVSRLDEDFGIRLPGLGTKESTEQKAFQLFDQTPKSYPEVSRERRKVAMFLRRGRGWRLRKGTLRAFLD